MLSCWIYSSQIYRLVFVIFNKELIHFCWASWLSKVQEIDFCVPKKIKKIGKKRKKKGGYRNTFCRWPTFLEGCDFHSDYETIPSSFKIELKYFGFTFVYSHQYRSGMLRFIFIFKFIFSWTIQRWIAFANSIDLLASPILRGWRFLNDYYYYCTSFIRSTFVRSTIPQSNSLRTYFQIII